MKLLHTIQSLKEWRERRKVVAYIKKKDIEAQEPRKPLPLIRRPLTPVQSDISRCEDIETCMVQKSSLFFTKLPYDIRRQIYVIVLCGNFFHLVQKCSRLAFLLCRTNGVESHNRAKCWGFHSRDSKLCFRYWGPYDPHDGHTRFSHPNKAAYITDGDLLPLVLSCRLIYSEVIDMVYIENTFAFCEPFTMDIFCSIVPKRRLMNLRHLYVELFGEELIMWPSEPLREEKDWIQFWSFVSLSFPSLQILEVKLCGVPHFWFRERLAKELALPEGSTEQHSDLLGPLRDIKGIEKFKLMLHRRYENQVFLREDDPFQIEFLDWCDEYGRF